MAGGTRFVRLPGYLCHPIRRRTLVDGFLTAPVPVEGTLLLGADIVIAVYLEAGNVEEPRHCSRIFSAARSTFSAPHGSDLRTGRIGHRAGREAFVWDDIYEDSRNGCSGETAALAALPEIRAVLRGEKRDSAA